MKWGWSNFNEVLKLFFLIIQKMLSGRKNGLSITEWLMIFLTLFPPLYYIDAIAKNFTTAVWSEMRRSISCFLYLLCVFYYTENLKWTKMLSFNSYKLKALYKNNFRKFSQNFLENTCDELQRATLHRNCLTTSILLGVLSNFQGIFWQLFLNAKTWPMIHRDVQQDTMIHWSNFHFDDITLYTF